MTGVKQGVKKGRRKYKVQPANYALQRLFASSPRPCKGPTVLSRRVGLHTNSARNEVENATHKWGTQTKNAADIVAGAANKHAENELRCQVRRCPAAIMFGGPGTRQVGEYLRHGCMRMRVESRRGAHVRARRPSAPARLRSRRYKRGRTCPRRGPNLQPAAPPPGAMSAGDVMRTHVCVCVSVCGVRVYGTGHV